MAETTRDTLFKITLSLLGVFITALCGLNLWIVSGLDTKVFTHMTNHEIHIPRGQVVDSAVYELHCKEGDKMINMVLDEIRTNRVKLDNIQALLYEHSRLSNTKNKD